MVSLPAFRDARTDPARQNRLLRDWLFDDADRAALYQALRADGFPVLRCASLAATGDARDGEVFLVTRAEDVQQALAQDSVAPYAALESGGRFMLGLDDPVAHGAQRAQAEAALRFTADELRGLAREAVRRAAVLPLKQRHFNLPQDLAEEAALRYAELVFGLRHLAHRYLRHMMRAVYTRLSFQIIGRHFVAEAGLPPRTSVRSRRVVDGMHEEIRLARTLDADEARRRARRGLSTEGVIQRLYQRGLDEALIVDMVVGLVGGTVGNLQSAVTGIVASWFDGAHTTLDQARALALEGDDAGLQALVEAQMAADPPAPFLTREHRGGGLDCDGEPVPAGATLLLAMGADPRPPLVFGGIAPAPFVPLVHHCVGRHLALPLIVAVVGEVLRLPGLHVPQRVPAGVPGAGEPNRTRRRWGAICERYWIAYRRDQRLNTQPLHVVLPLKQPYAESAAHLEGLVRYGAFVVQDALDEAKHVHYAWFMLVENRTHLAMMTTYDGDFDSYVEHFATTVSLFDEQLKYLEGAPEAPVSKNPKAFVDWIRRHNRAPLGGYFYSAYPRATAARIAQAFDDEAGRP